MLIQVEAFWVPFHETDLPVPPLGESMLACPAQINVLELRHHGDPGRLLVLNVVKFFKMRLVRVSTGGI